MTTSNVCDLTRFNKIAIQGIPQMAVDKEVRAYRESTHTIITVTFPYFMRTPHLIIMMRTLFILYDNDNC